MKTAIRKNSVLKLRKKNELYGQSYRLARKRYSETPDSATYGLAEIIFEDKTLAKTLDIDPKWDEAECERQAELYLKELAKKLDTPEKLAVFMKHFLSYVHDSPDPDHPEMEGVSDENLHGQYTQTAIDTVLRQKNGKLRGDCDDYAIFAREILVRNKNVVFVHTLGVPKHATCLWVQKTEKGYLAATLGTFGLDQQDGATVDEAYSKIVQKYKGGGLGLEKGTKIDESDTKIEILYGLKHEETKRVLISKQWLDPNSKEGHIFFIFTRAMDKNNQEAIVKYGKELAALAPDHAAWCEEYIYEANLKLGRYEECLQSLAEIKNDFTRHDRLARLIVKSDFKITDGLIGDGTWHETLRGSFDLMRIKENQCDNLIALFKKMVALDKWKTDNRLYTQCARRLIWKEHYHAAFEILKSSPKYSFSNIGELIPHLNLQTILKEMPRDIGKINPGDYLRCLQVCAKVNDPFAEELLKAIESKMEILDFATEEDLDFLIGYYEQTGKNEKFLLLRRLQLKSMEKYFQRKSKGPGMDFYELAAQDDYYLKMAALYTFHKQFPKLAKLHAARKIVKKHMDYLKTWEENPAEHEEIFLGYIEWPKKAKRGKPVISSYPSRLMSSDLLEISWDKIEKIPIIKTTKTVDPDGYRWAKISPWAKEMPFKGEWIRLEKDMKLTPAKSNA